MKTTVLSDDTTTIYVLSAADLINFRSTIAEFNVGQINQYLPLAADKLTK
jgi:hypothetical protein